MVKFTYVDSDEELIIAHKEWKSSSDLGVDLECENNLHHYGVYITIFQITNGKQHWIVDMLAIKDPKLVCDILVDEKIQKIFHDLSFDLRVIKRQYGCLPKNVFDTQLAALFLGEENVGLSNLLEKYFSIEKEKKFQKADWCKRPLSKDMLSYAIKDTVYLIQLRNILIKQLKKLDRYSWLKEELIYLEKQNWDYKEPGYKEVKGFRNLSESERGIFKRLWTIRERMAKKTDRPVHFIVNNKRLIALSSSPPESIGAWKQLRSVHPKVKANAKEFFDAVKLGKDEPILIPKPKAKKMSQSQKVELDKLLILQHKIADKLGIQGYLIMNREQMISIVVDGNYSGLRKWQKNLLMEQK
jgi:ribonuclease D